MSEITSDWSGEKSIMGSKLSRFTGKVVSLAKKPSLTVTNNQFRRVKAASLTGVIVALQGL